MWANLGRKYEESSGGEEWGSDIRESGRLVGTQQRPLFIAVGELEEEKPLDLIRIYWEERMFNGKTSSRNKQKWTNGKKHMNPCVSRCEWAVSVVVGRKDSMVVLCILQSKFRISFAMHSNFICNAFFDRRFIRKALVLVAVNLQPTLSYLADLFTFYFVLSMFSLLHWKAVLCVSYLDRKCHCNCV